MLSCLHKVKTIINLFLDRFSWVIAKTNLCYDFCSFRCMYRSPGMKPIALISSYSGSGRRLTLCRSDFLVNFQMLTAIAKLVLVSAFGIFPGNDRVLMGYLSQAETQKLSIWASILYFSLIGTRDIVLNLEEFLNHKKMPRIICHIVFFLH